MPSGSTWMDLEIIIQSEVSQIEKDKYITHIWNLFFLSDTNKFIYKTETDLRYKKQTYSYQRGNLGLRDKSGIWK